VTITPVQITGIEAMLNAIAGMFLPAGAVVILQEAETIFNVVSGANPPTAPILGGVLTNHLGQKYGLYVIPMGAVGTSVTITF
jgi:hypothetical protein